VSPSDPPTDPQLDELLDYVLRTRNSDFTGYKRASLTRRITKRMQALGLDSYAEYTDRLEVDPDEFNRFFDNVLINVTSFFRDPAAWDALRELVATRFASRGPDAPIRVWSAGTSTGQEAYSLAILLAEVLGAEQFKRRVKIYGTDVDDDALATARHAAYRESDFESLPPDLRATYFEQLNGEVTFRSDLRRAVIFGRHDLVQDAPISRLDLLVCRNTLMYFNSETQARILDRFHFALADDGLLFLGQAETLMTHGRLFVPLALKHRLFEKATGIGQRERTFLGRARPDERVHRAVPPGDPQLTELSFDTAPVPGVVVDASGRVALINGMARRTFRLSELDVGRPFQDLELSFRPVELRSSIETAYRERRPVVHRDVEHPIGPGQSRYLDIEAMPIFDHGDAPAGVSITFADVTRHRELQDELAQSKHQLEDAYEELQSTNEELETTNEELQSTVEELETTNEELQSTNEELETMNEELQSTNDELQSANEELRLRGDQLNEVNAFLESILTGLKRAVIVVDQKLVVQVWNDLAEGLWGLRPGEVVGHHLTSLDIGLPVNDLIGPVQRVITGAVPTAELTIVAHNRRGQTIRCATVVSPRLGVGGTVAGALLIMQEEPVAPDAG
jgi:two-component system CheB/CheR fusion protein